MQKELILHQLRLLSSLMNIPLSVYQDDQFLCSFASSECSAEFSGMWRKLLQDHTENPCFVLTDALVLFGEVRQEETRITIDVGPIRYATVPFQAFFQSLSSQFPELNEEKAREISLSLSASQSCSPENFKLFLSLLHSLLTKDCSSDFAPSAHRKIPYSKTSVPTSSTVVFSDYERKLLYYVQNGLVAPLRKMQPYEGELPSLAADPLRMCKNALIILNSLCQRAANAGGLEPHISHRIGLSYIQKIESCQTISELAGLNENMQIPVDYAERVAGVLFPHVSDPHVQKAIRYIRQNFQSKLTAEQIASEVHLAKEYLSTRFHSETGMTIPSYIARQKVIAAKELLAFTDSSLIDISCFLSFSSQSYFQSVFKKIAGETPQAYRLRSRRPF